MKVFIAHHNDMLREFLENSGIDTSHLTLNSLEEIDLTEHGVTIIP